MNATHSRHRAFDSEKNNKCIDIQSFCYSRYRSILMILINTAESSAFDIDLLVIITFDCESLVCISLAVCI